MSENKRYYWLKLKEDFFEDDTVTWLEEQENGKDYVIFYLKLCLKSLDNEGYLIRYVGETLIPYNINALAKLTNTSPDTVAVAMKTFLDIGLVARLETGEFYMNQINEMIGKETDSARRMRKSRSLKDVKQGILEQPSHCDRDVQKSDTEIEKDKELDKEKDKDKELGVKKEKEYSMDLKEKKKKEVKHKYGEFDNVLLTDVEYNKLQERFPHDLKSRIERLSGYVASTGKSYKSHYATVINWAKKDKPEDSRSVSVLDKIKQME